MVAFLAVGRNSFNFILVFVLSCIAGWGSSLKLLETQKILQEKKLSSQNVKVSKMLEKFLIAECYKIVHLL